MILLILFLIIQIKNYKYKISCNLCVVIRLVCDILFVNRGKKNKIKACDLQELNNVIDDVELIIK